MKALMVRLPDQIANEIQQIADRKGLPFSTCVKEIVCEYIYELRQKS